MSGVALVWMVQPICLHLPASSAAQPLRTRSTMEDVRPEQPQARNNHVISLSGHVARDKTHTIYDNRVFEG